MAEEAKTATKKRVLYYDGVKLLAIFVVFASHFLSTFNSDYLDAWESTPVIGGISGKFGVAFFSVILGYFAYKSSEQSVVRYAANRYFYFFVCCLFINCVYGALGAAGIFGSAHGAREILKASFTLSADIYKTLWCVRPFFFASVFSRINGRAKLGPGGLATEILILLWLGNTWTAICVMGNLIAVLEENGTVRKLAEKRMVRVLLLIGTLIVTDRPRTTLTFIIYGVCAAALVTVLPYSTYCRRALEWEPLASQGRNTMVMYLIHRVVIRAAGTFLIEKTGLGWPYLLRFILGFILSWIIVVALSYPLTAALNKVCKAFNRMTFAAQQAIEQKSQN